MQRNLVNISQDIFTITVYDMTGPSRRAISCQGVGFLVGPGIFVTCWHCVKAHLSKGQTYLAVMVRGSDVLGIPISKVEQDQNGTDLAIGEVDLQPIAKFPLSNEQAFPLEEVFTYGTPLAEKQRLPSGDSRIRISPRAFQGYIMRTFNYDHKDYGRTHSYELSFPGLDGLSGAPLIGRGPRIIGVIYGNHDTYTIIEEESKDPETGEYQTEARRVVSFGLAMHTDVVTQARTSSTGRRPLIEYLNSK